MDDKLVPVADLVIDDKSEASTEPEIAYIVPWIEVEFGWSSRQEGYVVFVDLDTCRKETLAAAKNGAYTGGGGYFGPERPEHYYEIPFSYLPKGAQTTLINNRSGRVMLDRSWSPLINGRKGQVVQVARQIS